MDALNTPVEIAALLARSPMWVRKFIATHNVPNRAGKATKTNSVRRYRLADVLDVLAQQAADSQPAHHIARPRGRKVDLLDPVAIATDYLTGAVAISDLAEKHSVNERTINTVLRYGLKTHYGLDAKHVSTLLRSRRYIKPHRTEEVDRCQRCYLIRTHDAVPNGRHGHCGWCVAELSGTAAAPETNYTNPSPTAGAVAMWGPK